MSDLPPLDQPQAYVVVGPNDQRGPYAMELLISEVIAGRLSDETPVWWPGLADWTTMGAHPGVAAELQRRRTPAAPAWADPTAAAPAPDPVSPYAPAAEPAPAQPAPEPAAAPQAVPADPFAAPVTAPEPVVEAEIAEPLAAEATEDAEEYADDDIEDAIVVDDAVLVTETVVMDDGTVVESSTIAIAAHHVEAYSGLVARSSARAQIQERVDDVDERVVTTVIAGAADRDFQLAERTDVDRGHELRFDSTSGDLLVISLGRVAANRVEDIRSEHLPLTISFRSGSYRGGPDAGDGAHGEVRVVADEWTGQATSTVSLFLGLSDYLDDGLGLDETAMVLDIAAAIAVVQHRLR